MTATVIGAQAQKLNPWGLVYDGALTENAVGEVQIRPVTYMGDIHGMIDYISQLPGVDKERIGAFGICGGGGYTVGTAQSDKRIKAVATLSMFNTGRVRRNGYCDSQISTIQERLAQASAARQQEAETES